MRIKCKHHSLEVSEDDIVLSLNEPGVGAESASGVTVGGSESGRGSSTSLKHLLERNNSGEIVILTPSKITIENYPMVVRVPRTAPTTPEHRQHRREVIVSPLPDYATAPSPIHWHFPCSDSDGTGNSGSGGGGGGEGEAGGGGEDTTTTSTSTDESHTVIQNFGKGNSRSSSGRSAETKTVSIWRTSENSDEEASAVIFHHESGTVENYSSNNEGTRTYIRMTEPNSQPAKKSAAIEETPLVSGPVLNNAIGTPKSGHLKMSHNNAFPTLSSVHDLSNEIRRFQKTSNFEPLTSNNLLSTLERNQRRETDPQTPILDAPSTSRHSTWNNGTGGGGRRTPRSGLRDVDNSNTTDLMELPSYAAAEDRLDLTSRLETFVRRFNKPSSIALTTLNRLSPTATGHLSAPPGGTGGRIRNRFGGIERRRRRRKHYRSQIATIRRLLGGGVSSNSGGGDGGDDDHPHLLQTELDWINEDLMRTQAEHREGNSNASEGEGRGGAGGGSGVTGLMSQIRRRVKRTFTMFRR